MHGNMSRSSDWYHEVAKLMGRIPKMQQFKNWNLNENRFTRSFTSNAQSIEITMGYLSRGFPFLPKYPQPLRKFYVLLLQMGDGWQTPNPPPLSALPAPPLTPSLISTFRLPTDSKTEITSARSLVYSENISPAQGCSHKG